LFSANGQTLTADITLPAMATLRVTAIRNFTALQNAYVQLQTPFTTLTTVGVTDATGTLLVPNVLEGVNVVKILEPFTFGVIGTASVTVTSADQGRTIDVPFALGNSLPVYLYDGNGMVSDIQRAGQLGTGSNGAFNGYGDYLYVQIDPQSEAF